MSSGNMAKPSARSARETAAPRERILSAARDLFHRHGIHSVGVDAIAETAATNKMTLYRHFDSKDLLVAECLREWAAEIDAAWDKNAKAHAGDPRARLLGWVRNLAEFKLGLAERGCAFLNAAAELPDKDHPARSVIREHKTALRERLIRLCRDARLADPERLADEIFLIWEGARVTAQSVGSQGLSSRLAEMFEALVAYHARGDKRSELQRQACAGR